jgi:hypothetical protein
VPFAHQFVYRLCQESHIGKDDDIGQQMMGCELFAHLASIVGRNNPCIAKREPFPGAASVASHLSFKLPEHRGLVFPLMCRLFQAMSDFQRHRGAHRRLAVLLVQRRCHQIGASSPVFQIERRMRRANILLVLMTSPLEQEWLWQHRPSPCQQWAQC